MKGLLFVLLLLVPLLTFADKKGKGGMRKEKELVGVVTGALCGIKHQVCSHPRGERYELLGILDHKRVHRERATIIAHRILKGNNVVWEGSEKTNPK